MYKIIFIKFIPMGTLNLLESIDNSFKINCHKIPNPEVCSQIISKYTLKILNINIRSIQKNFDNFLVIWKRLNTDFDVIIFSECWLNENSIIGQIQGYTSFHSKKYINKSGGVTAYVKDTWSPIFSELDVDEANCISIEVPNCFKVIAAYRSPSFLNPNAFITSLDLALRHITQTPCLIFAGDINLDILASASSNTHTSEYLSMLAEYGLFPSIDTATHQKTCLDHIFVPIKCQAVSVVCTTDLTDHDITMAGITISSNERPKPVRLKTTIDYDALRLDLESVDWSPIIKNDNLENAIVSFSTIITNCVSKHSKITKISRSKFIMNSWMTPGLIRCSKHRDKLHQEHRKDPNNSIKKVIYTRYRNYYITLLRNLKYEHDNREITQNKHTPKKLWDTIRRIIHKNNTVSVADALTKTKSSAEESLDYCNSYFSSVGASLASSILTKINETQESLAAKISISDFNCTSFFIEPTDEYEVSCLIESLDTKSAPGIDGINNGLLKAIRGVIAKPLAAIFNLSISTGHFPQNWKTATVIPIHKNGRKDIPNNYRPISLLSAYSKILERIVNKRLIKFLEKSNLLSPRQFAFRQSRSTEDVVTLLTNTVVSHLDEGHSCTGVFLDLAKAFDTVSVPILLRKLEAYGVRGTALHWFSSYLANRSQCVKVNGLLSSQKSISFGVPQGSILGPTLFITYINDLMSLQIPNCEILCYADDTALIFHGQSWNSVHNIAVEGMREITTWLNRNLLTLNVEKTHFLNFHKTSITSPPSRMSFLKLHTKECVATDPMCSCKSIRRTDCLRYLGVILDENLNFKKHIGLTAGRVRKLIYTMKLLREATNGQLLKTIYLALCQSILNYCILAWGGTASTSLLALERAQRAVLKVSLRKPRRYPTVDLYKEAQVLSVRRLFLLRATLFTHQKTLNMPSYSNLLKKRIFKIPTVAVCTSFAQRFQMFLFPRIYNTLANKCNIQLCSVLEAKKKIQAFLLSWDYEQSEAILRVIS